MDDPSTYTVVNAGLPPLSRADGVDRRVLLAERDAARADRRVRAAQDETALARAETAMAEALAEQERRRADALADELAKLYASSSWRWSAPVRGASFALQKMRSVFGGPPPRPPAAPAVPLAAPEQPPRLTAREAAILTRLRHTTLRPPG